MYRGGLSGERYIVNGGLKENFRNDYVSLLPIPALMVMIMIGVD